MFFQVAEKMFELFLNYLKPDTIKAICEYVINIINKNTKVSDQEKEKVNINGSRTIKDSRTHEPKHITKEKEKKLVQEGRAFLAPLLALALEICWVPPF